MGDQVGNPVVSLTGSAGPRMSLWLGLVEYCAIMLEMDVASCGLVRLSVGIGEWPEVEVRIRVFMGLTKHPRGAPIEAKLSHKNWRSSRGTQADTSSTYPRR